MLSTTFWFFIVIFDRSPWISCLAPLNHLDSPLPLKDRYLQHRILHQLPSTLSPTSIKPRSIHAHSTHTNPPTHDSSLFDLFHSLPSTLSTYLLSPPTSTLSSTLSSTFTNSWPSDSSSLIRSTLPTQIHRSWTSSSTLYRLSIQPSRPPTSIKLLINFHRFSTLRPLISATVNPSNTDSSTLDLLHLTSLAYLTSPPDHPLPSNLSPTFHRILTLRDPIPQLIDPSFEGFKRSSKKMYPLPWLEAALPNTDPSRGLKKYVFTPSQLLLES